MEEEVSKDHISSPWLPATPPEQPPPPPGSWGRGWGAPHPSAGSVAKGKWQPRGEGRGMWTSSFGL